MNRPHRATIAYALLSLLCWSLPVPATDQLPIGTLADAAQAGAFTPDRVPGANDWNCVPTAANPYPVVLVHGTMVNTGFAWAALAPQLKNAGYCVYALSYGNSALSLGQRAGALTDIAASTGELKTFIARVLAATKAAQVDIVGHSHGDTVPGPNYVVIATAKDLVITPYTQSFLKGERVRNITIQDQCPADETGHIALPFDGPTIQNVLNVLGANDPGFKAECRGYGNAI